jgi:GntR family transcriptional regulator
MPALGPAQPLPRYLQLTELLTREIAAGRWRVGERLPTEAELAARLGVAVGTLRKALAELATRGLIERRQGSGTYVRQAEPGGRSAYGFFRLEARDGGPGLPGAEPLALAAVDTPALWPADPADAAHPADRPARCWQLRRLRRLDGAPVALEQICFDARHAAELDAAALSESLYHHYETAFGFWIAQVEDRLGLAPVPDWAPPAFGLPVCTPTVCIERRAWSQHGRLEEVSLTWLDPARARYVARWR